MRLVNTLMQDPEKHDRALARFARPGRHFPELRIYLGLSTEPEFWKRPEALDFVKEAVIPAAATPRVEPWFGLGPMLHSSESDGHINALATRLLDGAAARHTLNELAGEVVAVLARHPKWLAGKGLLGMIRIRQGQAEEGRQLLETLLADPATSELLDSTVEELQADLEPCALSVYERAKKSRMLVILCSGSQEQPRLPSRPGFISVTAGLGVRDSSSRD